MLLLSFLIWKKKSCSTSRRVYYVPRFANSTGSEWLSKLCRVWSFIIKHFSFLWIRSSTVEEVRLCWTGGLFGMLGAMCLERTLTAFIPLNSAHFWIISVWICTDDKVPESTRLVFITNGSAIIAQQLLRFQPWNISHPSCQPPTESVFFFLIGLKVSVNSAFFYT